MNTTFQISSPVVIGGVGGSGTRVITQILMDSGFYMGSELNKFNDNLWFTLLFKRPSWLRNHAKKDKSLIFVGLEILTKSMVGISGLSDAEIDFITNAADDCVHPGLIDTTSIMRGTKGIDFSKYVGWGWKEPNTHMYLEYLVHYFKNLKYIHVIRHGLDMAYSNNQQQLFNWGPLFGVSIPSSVKQLPKAALEYWVKSNQKAINIGKQMGVKRFLLQNFDKLCSSPPSEIENILKFLELDKRQIELSHLCSLVEKPRSSERYKQHDLSILRREDIETVGKLGFTIEM